MIGEFGRGGAFDSTILLGGGVGEMIDDPMELPSYDFVLNGDIRKLYVPLIAELIRTADWHLC